MHGLFYARISRFRETSSDGLDTALSGARWLSYVCLIIASAAAALGRAASRKSRTQSSGPQAAPSPGTHFHT